MKIREQIQRLSMIKDEAQQAIEALQSECLHDQFYVLLYAHRSGAMTPQRICSECSSVVPGVTEAESQACWAKFGQSMKDLG